MERAKQMAAEATEWARREMIAPSTPKPASITQKDWKRRRDNTFAMYADTYAYILDKSGN